MAQNRSPAVRVLRNAHIAILLVLATFVLGWFVVNRVLSPWNVIHVVEASRYEPSSDLYDGQLRLGAYNIAHGRGLASGNWTGETSQIRTERLDQIADFFKTKQLDIVVLNEVDFDAAWSGHVNQAEYIARRAGFPYRAEQRNLDIAVPFLRLRFGNAILSRYPIERVEGVGYPAVTPVESLLVGHKKGLYARIRLDDETSIGVVGVHLDTRSDAVRVASARSIIALARSESVPIFLAGDFNTCVEAGVSGNAPIAGAALAALIDADLWTPAPSFDVSSSHYTFPSRSPVRTIDWVMIPHAWRLLDVGTPAVHHSDHLPIHVTVIQEPLPAVWASEAGSISQAL